jgi:hypothetical protein
MSFPRIPMLALIALLPVVAAATYDIVATRRSAEAQISDRALRLTKYFGAEQDRISEGAQQLLVALSNLESVRAKDAVACNRQFVQLAPKYPSYLALAAYDIEGEPFCSSIGSIKNAKDQGFFRTAVKDLRFTTGNYSMERGLAGLSFAQPIESESGQLIGIVEAKLSLAWLEAYFKEQIESKHASLTIADKFGTLLVRLPRAGKIGRTVPDSYRPLLATEREGTMHDESFDHVSRTIGFIPVGVPPAAEFFISAGFSEEEALAPAESAMYRSLALIGFASLSGLAAAWAFSRRYGDPARGLPAAVAPAEREEGRPRISLVSRP